MPSDVTLAASSEHQISVSPNDRTYDNAGPCKPVQPFDLAAEIGFCIRVGAVKAPGGQPAGVGRLACVCRISRATENNTSNDPDLWNHSPSFEMRLYRKEIATHPKQATNSAKSITEGFFGVRRSVSSLTQSSTSLSSQAFTSVISRSLSRHVRRTRSPGRPQFGGVVD